MEKRIIKQCNQCNKNFMPRLIVVKKGQGKFCSIKCYNIWQKGKHHSPNTEFKKGDKGHWKGGRIIQKGYIMFYNHNHPYTRGGKYVCEHRLVMEKHLGRYLKPTERIHHINGNKQDNRLKNLILFKNESEHQKLEQGNKSKAIINDGKRKCTKCHKLLPVNNFNKNNHSLTGYRPNCRNCQKKQYYISKNHLLEETP